MAVELKGFWAGFDLSGSLEHAYPSACTRLLIDDIIENRQTHGAIVQIGLLKGSREVSCKEHVKFNRAVGKMVEIQAITEVSENMSNMFSMFLL